MTLKDLEKIRRAGNKPKGMVLLSLLGELKASNPVVTTSGFDDYRSLVGLDIQIIHGGRELDTVINMIQNLIKLPVNNLSIRRLPDNQVYSIVCHGSKFIHNCTGWV